MDSSHAKLTCVMAKRAKLWQRERALTAYFTAVGDDSGSTSQSSFSVSENVPESCQEAETESKSGSECEPEDDCRDGESEDAPPDEREDLLLPTSRPVCNSFCCTSSEVYQPLDSDVLKKTERVYGTGNNKRTRRLLPTWYKSFPWLHFCCSTLRVYCHLCMLASELNIRIPKADTAFSTEGFCNWKKATVRFKEHELSHAHQVAIEAHVSRKRPINQLLERQLNQTQHNRRYSLLKQLSALRYLLRQGLAVRNDHAGGSNLTIMLQTVLDEDTWVQDKRYQSPEIVNELIEIMGHSLLRSMLANILHQKWFALLADETRDVSNREQLVLCIRWVSESYKIHEDVVGLIQLENTTAESIHKALKCSC